VIGQRHDWRRAARLPLVVLVLLCIAMAGTMVLAVPDKRRRQRALHAMLCRTTRVLLRVLGVRQQNRGPSIHGPALVAANHLGWLDVVTAVATWPCTFVAKQEVRSWPVVGRLAVALGVVFVDRARKRDLIKTIPALEEALREGRAVLLFPESTTTDGQDVLPFRSALFEAAVRAGAPVFPLALSAAGGDAAGSVACWTGDETLVRSVWRLAGARQTTFSLHVGAPIAAGNARKPLAALARAQVLRRFTPVDAHPVDAQIDPEWSAGDDVAHWPQRQRLASTLGAPILAVLLALSVGYAAAPVYRFDSPRQFSGEAWYNPYATLDTARSQWLLANFHAHSAAWGGLTRGEHSPDSVVSAYRRARYDVIGVSNYHATTSVQGTSSFRVYEHGWNARKSHQLVFEPDRVVWFDYPLPQSLSQQQRVLDALAESASLVAIAHPGLRDAYSPTALASLTHYDLLEVLNRYAAPADTAWDAALSSGHAVWLLASDDSHNPADPSQIGVNATYVNASSTRRADVLDALRGGHAYGVHRGDGSTSAPPLRLHSIAMRGDTLRVALTGQPDTVRVVGQQGRVRAEVHGTRARTGVLEIVARPDDGYLRVVAIRDDQAMLYTNPVLRWNGREIPRLDAVVDGPRTALWRTGWGCAYVLVATLLLARRQRAWSAWPRPTRPQQPALATTQVPAAE